MRSLLIRGGLLLDASRPEARPGDILVRDQRIVAVLAAGEDAPADCEILDASDRLLIPGLVNAHTHSHLAFAKGVQDRWTLELHLNAGPWTNVLLNHEERRLATLLSAAEMIAKGCTAAYDLHFEIPEPTAEGMQTVANAYREAGMRALIAPMLADRSIWTAVPGLLDAAAPLKPPGLAASRATSDVVSDFHRLARGWSAPRVEAGLGLAPTIPHHCSDALLRGAARISSEEGTPLHMHLGESKLQAVVATPLYGKSLTAHIADIDLLSERFTAAHAVWLDDADLDLLAGKGAMVAHNPASNLRLGNGIAPVRRMLNRGLHVGIGTDATSCADGLNMFEATRTAKLVSHNMSADPERWLSAQEAFHLATHGSAKLMGLENDIGLLKAGFLADIVFLDLGHLNYIPLNNALHQVVMVETGAAVRRVMVGGRTVYKDGAFVNINLAALRRDVERVLAVNREHVAERQRLCDALAPILNKSCLCMTTAPLPYERRFEWA